MNKQHVLQRRIIFGLLFLGGVTFSYASTEKDLGSSTSAITQQAVTVKGSVKDAAGEAIIGASVVVDYRCRRTFLYSGISRTKSRDFLYRL